MDEKERARALEATLGQIEKQFGKGSILRLGSKDAIVPVAVISSGEFSSQNVLLPVDYARLAIFGIAVVAAQRRRRRFSPSVLNWPIVRVRTSNYSCLCLIKLGGLHVRRRGDIRSG